VTSPEPNAATQDISPIDDPLDWPLYGAAAIAAAAHILHTEDKKGGEKKGEPDLRKTYYLLEIGALPATKLADGWVSTRRRLRDRFNQVDQVGGVRAPGRGRKPKGAAKKQPARHDHVPGAK
jgi:hypothetical protein